MLINCIGVRRRLLWTPETSGLRRLNAGRRPLTGDRHTFLYWWCNTEIDAASGEIYSADLSEIYFNVQIVR